MSGKRYSDGPSQHSQITDQQREIRDFPLCQASCRL